MNQQVKKNKKSGKYAHMSTVQVSNKRIRFPTIKGSPKGPQRTFRCRCLDARAGAGFAGAQTGSQVHRQVSPASLCPDTWDLPALVSWMPQVVSQRCQWCPRPLQPGCLLAVSSVGTLWFSPQVADCVCVGVFVLSVAPGSSTYLICPLTQAANCDAPPICTLGCRQSGWELIVMGPWAAITLVIGRWVPPLGAT